MRQLMVICAAVAATCALGLTSCEKKGNKGLRTDAMLAIRPAAGAFAAAEIKANPEHLSALEIVKQADQIAAIPAGRRGFADYQKDIVNVKLLMFSSDIVMDNGELQTGWIEARDFVIVRDDVDGSIKDTIAYLPNAVVIKAEQEIKAAYAKGDYEACYTLFDKAFRFTPITGPEWLALKAQGIN